jgi:hypothetical protein
MLTIKVPWYYLHKTNEENLMRFTTMASLLLLAFHLSFSAFDPCKFNFGMAWNGSGQDYSEVDYITIWAGSDEEFNQNWMGAMLQKCKSSNQTPIIYSAIIASTARRDLGLADCGAGIPNLCEQGAKYIRDKKSRIMGQYDKYITGVKHSFGTTDPVIWLMEPDFYRYCEGSQEGGALSGQDAGNFMHEIVAKIKASLPNAAVSMDISPWISDQSNWLGSFQMDDFAFLNTSGGQTEAASGLIRKADPASWKGMHDLVKKCIIADDGYAAGGFSGGHDPSWDDVNNLNARISDGLIAITQANPKSDWAGTIKTIRPQLGKPVCPCQNLVKTRFSLAIAATGSGSVSVSPAGASFDSGASVTVLAKPDSGETFIGWSGALSGSNGSETIIMNSDKSISAAFTANVPKSYLLTVKTTGAGTVSVSPQAPSYLSGTSVTLTATPGTGATFMGWSGGLSGSNSPAIVTITSNLTIVATFYGGPVAGNLVKNGDFTANAEGWGLGIYDAAKATGGQSGGKYTVTTQTVGANEWNIQLSQNGIKLDSGKTYSLSFRASAKANTTLQVNVGMAGEPYASYSDLQTINLTVRDSVYVVAFPMNKASTTNARIEFNAGKTSGTWSIDDIVLVDQSTVGVRNPFRFFTPKKQGQRASPIRGGKLKITLYDFSGRVVRESSGAFGDGIGLSGTPLSGLYLMVIKGSSGNQYRTHIMIGR